MSSSPNNELSTLMSSPTRYHNRYSERYKSLLTESPPRDFSALRTPEKAPPNSTLKNSPLQSNREHRIFEGEKYTSLKVKNEDRGEWRESSVVNDEENVDEVEQVKVTKPHSPYQTTSSATTTTATIERVVSAKTPSPTHQKRSISTKEETSYQRQEKRPRQSQSQHHKQEYKQQQQQQQSEQPQPEHHRRSIPHYMQATSAYESRVHSNKERRSQPNLLGPRSKGGITVSCILSYKKANCDILIYLYRNVWALLKYLVIMQLLLLMQLRISRVKCRRMMCIYLWLHV